ncbi:MAG: hypothetical protein TH68_10630, partial [Candidatus Synechococcus spongiarum 142]
MQAQPPRNHAELISRLGQPLHLLPGARRRFRGQHQVQGTLEHASLPQPPSPITGRIEATGHKGDAGEACSWATGQLLLRPDPLWRQKGGRHPHMAPQHQPQHSPAGVEPVQGRAKQRCSYQPAQPAETMRR